MFYADPVIEVVEKQVEEKGGILGGRPLQIEKYDSQGTVSGALSAATKAIVGDKLSVVALGGTGSTEATPIAQVACEENAFFSCYVPIFDTPERECMVEATITDEIVIESVVTLISERLQPHTAAILALEVTDIHKLTEGWKSGLESAGIDVVYEEILTPGTMDYNSYLTRIKYLDPDVLFIYLNTPNR